MRKRYMIGSFVILLIISLGIGMVHFNQNYTSTEGYIVNKSEDTVRVISSNSLDEAKELYQKNDGRGIIFIRMTEDSVKKLKLGQKIKVYHSRRIYASSPGQVKPLFVQQIQK